MTASTAFARFTDRDDENEILQLPSSDTLCFLTSISYKSCTQDPNPLT